MAWPAIVAAIGSAAGGAGSMLSSLGGSSNDAVSMSVDQLRQQYEEQLKFDKVYSRKHPLWAAQGARAAGLNPLVSMGLQPSTFQPSASGVGHTESSTSRLGDAMQGLGEMGQSIARAASAYYDRAQKDSVMLDLESKQLRNEGQMLQNQALRKDLQDVASGPAYNFNTSGNDFDKSLNIIPQGGTKVVPDQVTAGSSMGKTHGIHHLETDYVDDKGYLWEIVNQQAGEALESDQAQQMRRTIVVGGKYIKGYFKPPVKPKRKAPPGYAWAYRKIRGQWQLVRAGSHKGVHQTDGPSGRTIYRGKIYN